MLPSTLTSTMKYRPLRAREIGELARYFAIFGVTHVFVYHDPDPFFDSHALGRYIVKVLRYAVAPPWLKKKAFPLRDTDRWFGLIPPLQIEAHMKEQVGGWGWGVVDGKLRPFFRGKPVSPYALNRANYIGFWAEYIPHAINDALKKVSTVLDDPFFIGTSRKGESIWDDDVRKRLLAARDRDVVILFGGHHRGIYEMGVDEKLLDVVINAYPLQRTKTIRTEEAVAIVLSVLADIVHF